MVLCRRCTVRLETRHTYENSAASLWGVDMQFSDGNNSHLTEVANELLDEALDVAKAKLVVCGRPNGLTERTVCERVWYGCAQVIHQLKRIVPMAEITIFVCVYASVKIYR